MILRITALLIALQWLTASLCIAEEPTTRTITLSALGLDGMPLANVDFRATGEDGAVRTLTTGATGGASTDLLTSGTVTNDYVVLEDDDWRVGSLIRTGKPSSKRIVHFYQLYRTDPATMTTVERQAYIGQLPSIMAYRRGIDPPGNELSALHLSAFLLGNRVPHVAIQDEAVKGPAGTAENIESLPDEDESPAPVLRTVVIDALGAPVAGRVAELYALNPGEKEATLVRRERTDAHGKVAFGRLDPAALYRIEAPEDVNGLSARGSIYRIDKDQEKDARPLILRDSRRTLSGFVFYGDKPLAGAGVSVTGIDLPRLATSTDEMGYFELAPLNVPIVDATVSLPRQGKSATMPLRIGATEVLLPLDVMLLPGKRSD